MALNAQLTNAAASAESDAVAALLNNGYLKLYTGTQPATGDTAIGAQTLLATLRFSATAFPASVNGVATANAITSDTSAAATGTATWFRTFKSDNSTAVFDGSVGTSGSNMNLNSTAIQTGAQVDCTSFTFTASKS